jgi:hypothetical protein
MTITIGGTGSPAEVTIYYTALPRVVPSYIGNLETAIRGVVGSNGSARGKTFTLEVLPGSYQSFSSTGRAMTVGDSFITNKSADDIADALAESLGSWLTMLDNSSAKVTGTKIL